MAAATTPKIKATPQSKAKSSSRQVEANRRNSQKSTGPRTAEGKGRSKYNALKHGRTAESTLLPGDDASLFHARRREIIEGMQPRNPVEGIFLDRIARCEWKSMRADLSASARLSSQLREESRKKNYDDKDEVIALGQHLLTHPPFPLPISSPNDKGYLGKAPLADVPGDPHHPARIVLKLEQTVCGCDWLLGRWAGLKLRLDIGGLWLMREGYEMVRLLGKYVIDMVSDYELEMLMLANICLAADGMPKDDGEAHEETGPMTVWEQVAKLGESENPFHSSVERLMTFCEPWARALANRPLERLAPENAAQARQWLTVAMDGEVNRLTLIRAERLRFAEADRAEAPARLAFETGTEGDRLRRYDLSRDRVLLRTVSEFVDVRKASIAGTFNLLDYDLDELTEFDDSLEPQALNAECQQEELDATAVPRRSRRRAPGDAKPNDRKTPVSNRDQEASCDNQPILRNEANLSVVSSPCSVISGPLSVISGSLSDASSSLSVDASMSVVHSEPAAADEIAASCPDPVDPPKTETGGQSEPGSSGGDTGIAVPNPAPEHQAETERRTASERLGDEIARQAMLRAENIRKLGDQWWNETEAAERACRARQRGHPNGNPGKR